MEQINKQSCVEWYVKQINILGDEVFKKGISLDEFYIKKNKILEQAKAMHKEEIISAYYEGKNYGFQEKDEQYYNETFKGGNK